MLDEAEANGHPISVIHIIDRLRLRFNKALDKDVGQVSLQVFRERSKHGKAISACTAAWKKPLSATKLRYCFPDMPSGKRNELVGLVPAFFKFGSVLVAFADLTIEQIADHAAVEAEKTKADIKKRGAWNHILAYMRERDLEHPRDGSIGLPIRSTGESPAEIVRVLKTGKRPRAARRKATA